ncbi:glycosyltransferase family 2 protein [Desulfococcus sp.]|uniref:glycosyltransferase family 2 protein n=1 Tax=Desulfococcus sp. TaxID=2025834 RepID=UPI003593705F
MEKVHENRDGVEISVVVCTYNRADMLEETLRSWGSVEKGECRVELVVVDNNSTDGTRKVVETFEKSHGGDLNYVFEPNPGLSFARNKGIKAARGRIIAFVDDDIYFREDWLQALVSVFQRHPKTDGVGGNSIPLFEGPRPDWLTDELGMFYGSTLSGETEKRMVFPEHPFGVNMAFRREVFVRVGGFTTRLGRIKTSLLSNEEKELFYRLHQAGMFVLYAPDIVVHHRVPKERMDQQWIIRRVFWQGISKVAFTQLTNRQGRFTLLRDALIHGKRAVFGQRPFCWKNCILLYPRQEVKEQMKTALSLGIARQSLIEFINFDVNNLRQE